MLFNSVHNHQFSPLSNVSGNTMVGRNLQVESKIEAQESCNFVWLFFLSKPIRVPSSDFEASRCYIESTASPKMRPRKLLGSV